MRELWVRWLQYPTMGALELKLTHNDIDKGGNEAQYLEASRIFSFSHLPRVPLFSFYDRAVQVGNAYGPRAISGGTAYGQQGIGGWPPISILITHIHS